MKRRIIGLAGFRQVGKSSIARHLRDHHGFRIVHPFEIWKDGIKAMLISIGINQEEAEDMVHGKAKDTPHIALPGDHDARYLMESLGRFAGVELGPDWTLGLALRRMDHFYPNTDLVIESIVYEVDPVRRYGGHIVMVERPNSEYRGLKTDEATKNIRPDSWFVNDSDNIDELMTTFDTHMFNEQLMPERMNYEY